MADTFDPYFAWLGIPPSEQPPHHYRLLGLKLFEEDERLIQDAVEARTTLLRAYGAGERGQYASELLAQVAVAGSVLLEAGEKASYDLALRRRLQSSIAEQVGSFTIRPAKDWRQGAIPQTADELRQCLVAAGLMSLEECASVPSQLSASSGQAPGDAKALASLLVKVGKLTRYQAAGLLQGKLRQLVFGEYLVSDKIGQGGMGQVLKASHRRMKRTVALKVISPSAMKNADSVRRFQREVEAAARLMHPNIVTAFDASEAGGVHFLVMEFVDGQDLATVVKEQGPLPIEAAIDVTLQAARGLAYAHENGLVHRDIKPSNLLLDRRGVVKVLDMGLARLETLGAAGEQLTDELTQSGQVMGTVDYMAPEQAIDTKTADARSDIYSLGCTLYKLLTGEVLYEGDTLIKKILAHRDQPIPPLQGKRPEAPAELCAVFNRMVAKSADERYQSMSEVVVALEAVQRTLPAQPVGDGTSATLSGSRLNAFLNDPSGSDGRSRSTALPEATLSMLQPTMGTEETLSRIVSTEQTDPGAAPFLRLEDRLQSRKPVRRQPLVLVAIGGAALVGGALLAIAFGTLTADRQAPPVASPPEEYKAPSEPHTNNAAAQAPAATDQQSASDRATDSVNRAPAGRAEPRYALEFDGASHVLVPSLTRKSNNEPLTIEAWVTPSTVFASPNQAIVDMEGGGHATLSHHSDNGWMGGYRKLVPAVPNPAVTWIGVENSRRKAEVGKRTHVALVLAPEGEIVRIRIYENGELVATKEHTGGEPKPNPGVGTILGGFFGSAGRRDGWQGTIDELRIARAARYDGSFTPEEVFTSDADTVALYHFNEGAGASLTDASGHGHDGAIVGARWKALD